MNRIQLEEERKLLERVADYREKYRESRRSVLAEERNSRHANGEVYFAGCWIPKSLSTEVLRNYRRRGRIVIVEIGILCLIALALAQGWSTLFAFLLMP